MSASATPTAGRRAWADRSVLTKIVAVVAVMAAAALLVTVVSLRLVGLLRSDAAEMYASRVVPLTQLTEIQRAYQGDRARVIQYGVADEATRADLVTELAERRTDLDALVEDYRAVAVDPAAVDTMVSAFDAYYAAAQDGLFPLADSGDTASFGAYFQESIRPLTTAVMDAIQVETAAQEEQASALSTHTEELAHTAMVQVGGAFGFGVLVAFPLAFVVARSIRRRLDVAAGALTAIGEGDLTVATSVDGQDEIGRLVIALQSTQSSLRVLVSGVVDTSRSVAAAAEELSSASSQVAAGADETSAQAGVVAAAAEQVVRNVQAVAAGAEEMGASHPGDRAERDRGGPGRRCGHDRGGGDQRAGGASGRRRARRSATSSRSSRASRSRRTCWPSTRRSRRRVPVRPARASRWWPVRSRSSPRRPRRRPRTSRAGWRPSRRTRAVRSRRSRRSRRSSRASTTTS